MGTGEGGARSRFRFFMVGQVYLGQNLLVVEQPKLRGRGLQPGQRVAGRPHGVPPPALRRPGAGVEAGPRVPRLRVHLRGGPAAALSPGPAGAGPGRWWSPCRSRWSWWT